MKKDRQRINRLLKKIDRYTKEVETLIEAEFTKPIIDILKQEGYDFEYFPISISGNKAILTIKTMGFVDFNNRHIFKVGKVILHIFMSESYALNKIRAFIKSKG